MKKKRATETFAGHSVIAGDDQTQQERYRVFIEDVADGVYETDLRGNFQYFNDALCRIFGYDRSEIQDRNFREFMDEGNAAEAFKRFNGIYRTGEGITDIIWEIIRKDGAKRTIELSANLIIDKNEKKNGFRGIARDVTREKRAARITAALFRIAKALYQFRGLDERLDLITKEVRDLMTAEGALVILIDEEKKEFLFRAAASDDVAAEEKYKETRFPLDKGVAGQVYRSGQPLIVPDYYNSPYSYHTIDEKTGITTRNMLDVPMRTEDRMIGVLCAVNKKEGQFDQNDIDLLSTFASIVALPIENARINEELQRSYEEVKSLNRAKDQVIHRLSHELKTPVSVLSASLGLLTNKLAASKDHGVERIIERSHRNLQRLLDMQYEIEDILRESDYRSRHLLSTLLDACADELEALVDAEAKDGEFVERIRERIDRLFGPSAAIPEEISLDSFIQDTVTRLRPQFAHRDCELGVQLEQTEKVWIPPEVLSKIAEGLIRNAVENTPDGSSIEISVRNGKIGPEFEVRDFGVGIIGDNQRHLFESYFTASDTMQYATRSPFDFAAGGRGFDLLRMKIFSERYDFKIGLDSRRCRYIPGDEDVCPGETQICSHLEKKEDCQDSGGTTVTVQFRPAAELMI